MKPDQPFEDDHDLTGFAAVDFDSDQDFKSVAANLANLDSKKYTPVALRVFAQKSVPVITLYAMEAGNKELSGEIPVLKIKLKISFEEFLRTIEKFDFTVTDGNVDLRKIRVQD